MTSKYQREGERASLELLDAKMIAISTHWRSSRVFMGLVGGILIVGILVAAWMMGMFRAMAFGPAFALILVLGFPLGAFAGVLRSNSYRDNARLRIQKEFEVKHPGLRARR